MKKTATKIILSATLIACMQIRAQVANYVFTQTNGTHVAISGGTVLGSSTTNEQTFVNPTITAGSAAGSNGPGLAIGFTFTFNGVPYDVLGINTNGWIAFGQSSLTTAVDLNSSSSTNPISATSSAPANLQQRVAGFSHDLSSQPGGELRMETIGITPNQTCVIQWANYRKANQNGDTLNFQIRLLETSNIVEVVYGKFINNTIANQVGYGGMRGTANTDFATRVINGINTWSYSATGLQNISAINFNATLTPVSGLTYRWYPPVPCSTISANSAVAQYSVVCPFTGSTYINLAYSYTNSGFTYQWYSSTVSASGPYQTVGTPTVANMRGDTLLSQNWYQAVITCANSSNSATSSPISVQIAGTTTNSVPYFEGFEGVVKYNELPNCSWMASSQATTCLTYTNPIITDNRFPHSGSKYASFYGVGAPNSNYFFTNGIQLEPGITYSTGVYYITDGNLSWFNLSLMLGTSQSASSMTNVASISPVTGQFYQLLSNTFTVATSGIYYLGIKCIENDVPRYLTFDDLFITMPCSLNSPSLTVSPAAYTICSGASVTLTATGANSYNWGNATGNSIVVSPQGNSAYNVIGTNSISGCQGTASANITVNPKPFVSIVAQAASICRGSSVTLHGVGNGQFSWSSGSSTSSIVVSPQVNTTYTLSVSGIGGCTNSTVQAITVNTPAPVFAQISPGNAICVGETAQLIGSGTGIVNFEWRSNDVTVHTKVAMVSPLISTTYTLTGTDANGCTNTQTVQLLVNPCTSIAENTGSNGLLVYPNPTSGQLIISTGNVQVKNIVVTDITGRLITTMSSSAETIELNLEGFAKGLYYAKIITNKESNVVKIVKE